MNELKPDEKPAEKLFYKYRSINQHLFDTLEYNELYFRDPRDYNDPIDSVVDGFIEGTFEELIDYHIENNEDGYSREDAVWNILMGVSVGDYKITGTQFRHDPSKKGLHFNFPNIPTYCLSEKNDDISMWGHYADHHKGVCLSFRSKYKIIPEENYAGYVLTINSKPIQISKVKYGDKMPRPTNFLADKDGKQLFEFLLTKGSCWGYEEEHRMILVPELEDLKNIKFVKELKGINCRFEKTELEGIIFGLKVKKCDALQIYRIIQEHYKGIPFNFYKAQKVENEYKIRIKPICKTGIDEYLDSLSI